MIGLLQAFNEVSLMRDICYNGACWVYDYVTVVLTDESYINFQRRWRGIRRWKIDWKLCKTSYTFCPMHRCDSHRPWFLCLFNDENYVLLKIKFYSWDSAHHFSCHNIFHTYTTKISSSEAAWSHKPWLLQASDSFLKKLSLNCMCK